MDFFLGGGGGDTLLLYVPIYIHFVNHVNV